jgi:hypothetical protein
MTQRRYHLDSAVRKDASQHPAGESSSAVQRPVGAGKHCAYNQTRERFLGADVDLADFSVAGADNRLPSLAANSGAGLWLIPFQGISPTNVRVPVDLVYLDRQCVVIDTVESFPIFQVSASSPLAASVLVLPAETIRSTETQPGDQLILCPPDEMKQRLQRLANPGSDARPEQPAAAAKDGSTRDGSTRDGSMRDASMRGGAGRLLQWEDYSRARNPEDQAPPADRTQEAPASALPPSSPALQETAALEIAAIEPAAAEPQQKYAKPQKSWLQRLLALDPPEPRKAARESMPGLAAYFFTGGAPVAHGVRDISQTGVYVLTQERWYPGTVVRVTLTDRLEPTAERSITLNMAVIRSGDDGVGLKFLLQNGKDRRQDDRMVGGADRVQVDQFLQRLRGA